MTLATRGLKFAQQDAGNPATKAVLGKVVETVAVDLEEHDSRILNLEQKQPVVDLGSGFPDPSTLTNGVYSYTEGGTRKVAVVVGGQKIQLEITA